MEALDEKMANNGYENINCANRAGKERYPAEAPATFRHVRLKLICAVESEPWHVAGALEASHGRCAHS